MIYSLGNRFVEFHGDDWFIAQNATVIGSVILQQNSSIWFNAVIRGDNDIIKIGENTNIQDSAVLHTDPNIPLIIGNSVTIGHAAKIHGCTIGDGSLVGINSVVLNRVIVGKNCLIGAHSLIPEGRIIEDRSLVLGSPAKFIRFLSPMEIDNLWSTAERYVAKFKQFKQQLLEQSKN